MAEPVNLEEMAGILRVSLPTMRKLAKLEGFPILQEGRNGIPWQLDRDAVKAFVAAKEQAEADARAAHAESLAQSALPMEDPQAAERDLDPAARLKLAQARKAEDDLGKQRGFLVSTVEMRNRLTSIWAVFTQTVLSWPKLWGRRYNLPDAVVRDMQKDVAALLRQMHAALTGLLPSDVAPPTEDDAPP